jgi:hypothetical protein
MKDHIRMATSVQIYCILWRLPTPLVRGQTQREERPREELLIDTLVKVVCYVKSKPVTVYSVLRSVTIQNILCWLAYFVHNGPDHLHLSFKSSPASSGRWRTGPPVYVKRVSGQTQHGDSTSYSSTVVHCVQSLFIYRYVCSNTNNSVLS